MAQETTSETAVPGLAARRIAADIVEGVLRSKRPLDEQLEASGLDSLEEERDRALVRAIVATVVRRLGTLRHLLAGLLERGLPGQRAAGRKRAADRRRADPVSRRAQSRRGRPFRAARAGGSSRPALRSAGQRRAAQGHARRRGTACGHRSHRARHAGVADEALAVALRRRDGTRHRRGECAGAGARSHGEERTATMGGAA